MAIWHQYIYTKGGVFEDEKIEVYLRKDKQTEDRFFPPKEVYNKHEMEFVTEELINHGWQLLKIVGELEDEDEKLYELMRIKRHNRTL